MKTGCLPESDAAVRLAGGGELLHELFDYGHGLEEGEVVGKTGGKGGGTAGKVGGSGPDLLLAVTDKTGRTLSNIGPALLVDGPAPGPQHRGH